MVSRDIISRFLRGGTEAQRAQAQTLLLKEEIGMPGAESAMNPSNLIAFARQDLRISPNPAHQTATRNEVTFYYHSQAHPTTYLCEQYGFDGDFWKLEKVELVRHRQDMDTQFTDALNQVNPELHQTITGQ